MIVGQVAGTVTSDGKYIGVAVDGRRYPAHRLAIFYVTGSWPERITDHRDLNGRNNCWANIRPATLSQNGANVAKSPNCSSQYKGVAFQASRKKWIAAVTKDGRYHFLGRFASEDDAAQAYRLKAIELFGEFARW